VKSITLALAGGVAVLALLLHLERGAHDKVRADFTEYRATAERLSTEADTRNRTIEQELQDAKAAQVKLAAEAARKIAQHRVAAAAASDRLRDAADAAAARAREQCTDSTPASGGEAADPGNMLALVLGEVDDIAGRLAEALDKSRSAGLTCERLYDKAANP
jgi:FtsZ-interacting cell division protein ZipA